MGWIWDIFTGFAFRFVFSSSSCGSDFNGALVGQLPPCVWTSCRLILRCRWDKVRRWTCRKQTLRRNFSVSLSWGLHFCCVCPPVVVCRAASWSHDECQEATQSSGSIQREDAPPDLIVDFLFVKKAVLWMEFGWLKLQLTVWAAGKVWSWQNVRFLYVPTWMNTCPSLWLTGLY